MWRDDLKKDTLGVFCIAQAGCNESLRLKGEEIRYSPAEINRTKGWFASSSWDDAIWDGVIFCPDHEDEAMEWLANED
jgi:hypothetical protein